MAIMESTEIRVLVDSIRDRDRDDPHKERHIRGGIGQWRRLQTRGCCVKSKAALLVLTWNTLVTVLMGYILEYGSVLATVHNHLIIIINNSQPNQLQVYAPAYFGFLALVYLFYPLAGCMTDIKCERYRTITNSRWFIIWGGLFTCIASIIMFCYDNNFRILSLQTVCVTVILAIGFGFPSVFGMMLLAVSEIFFSANVLQFGMDQLHDSPSEDSILFVH